MSDVNKEIALKVTADASSANKAFKSAQDELKQTQKALVEMALAGKQNTAEFRQMEQRAGQLRDAISDVRSRVNTLANDTPRIQLFGQAVQGVAAGFSVAQGAAGLFGEKNEDLQQSILKVQSAMAVANGVQQVANLLNKDSALVVQANAIAQRAYAVAVGTSTGALKLFRLALIATGIGAAVVAVGLLVSNFDKLKAGVMGFIETSKPLQAILEFITDKFTKLGRAIGIIPSESAKATRQMIDDLEKQKKLLEASGADTAAIQKRILELRLALAKETNKGIEEAEEELTLFMAGQYKKRADLDKAAKEKRLAEEKKLMEEVKKIREQAAADQKAIDQIAIDAQNQLIKRAQDAVKELAQLDEQRRRAGLTAREREREDIIAESERRIELLRASGASELEVQAEQFRLQGILRKQAADEAIAVAKQQAEEEMRIEQQKRDFMYAATVGGLQAIADITAFFAGKNEEQQRKAFEVQKAANIAITLIDTFLAAQKAYNSQLQLDPTAPIRAAIAASVAVASGLGRVAAIRRTTFGAASTSAAPQAIRQAGVPNPQAPQPLQPNVTTPNVPSQQQGTNTNGQQQPLVRAFVVDRDIENAQRRRNRLQSFAGI